LIRKSISDSQIKIDERFSFSNRSAIEKPFQDRNFRRTAKSDRDFRTEIDQRFQDQNRSPIYILKSISDFETAIAITIAIKN
jgi:hypothetical protein